MELTRTKTIHLVKVAFIIGVILLIVAYVIWRSLNYAKGPNIEISSPTNGALSTTSTITIVGQAERINNLLLNGKSIAIDEKGYFKETIIIFPGINFISLEGHDQFGRTAKKSLELVGSQEKL